VVFIGSQKNSTSSNVSPETLSAEGKGNDYSSYANFVIKRINTDGADLSHSIKPLERVSKLPSQIKEEEESIREETCLQDLEQQSSR